MQPKQNLCHGGGALSSGFKLVGDPFLGLWTMAFNYSVIIMTKEKLQQIFSSSNSCSEKLHPCAFVSSEGVELQLAKAAMVVCCP